MNRSQVAVLGGLLVALSTTASAQISVTGPGALIPANGSGGGGVWPDPTIVLPVITVLPSSPGTSAVNVPLPITTVHSIEITGLNHTYIGDLQLVLTDPNGVGHNIFVRPGVDFGGSSTGNGGDFLMGDYVFIESGGLALPTDNISLDQSPGTYSQSFTTGTTVWFSGDAGVFNTPLGSLGGPAGTWSLDVYDWASGDVGSFTSWTLNANGATGQNSGSAYCFGDSSGASCPCSAFGASGAGCATTSGSGATLSGSGSAYVLADSLTLSVSGAPANKPGIFFQGPNQLSVPAGDGILCSNSNLRYAVNSTDAGGNVSQTGFGANATAGQTLNYQYWFRDPANPCGAGFNFSGGWVVTWQ